METDLTKLTDDQLFDYKDSLIKQIRNGLMIEIKSTHNNKSLAMGIPYMELSNTVELIEMLETLTYEVIHSSGELDKFNEEIARRTTIHE